MTVVSIHRSSSRQTFLDLPNTVPLGEPPTLESENKTREFVIRHKTPASPAAAAASPRLCNLTCDKLYVKTPVTWLLYLGRGSTLTGTSVRVFNISNPTWTSPSHPSLPLFSSYFLFGSHPFLRLTSFLPSPSAHSVFEPVVIRRLRRGRAYDCSIATHHHPLSHRHHIMTIFSLIFESLTGVMMFLSAPHLLDRVLTRLSWILPLGAGIA